MLCHAEQGFTANVPLADCVGVDEADRPQAIVAYAFVRQPLEPDHGYPARFLVPRLYFWKSAKWLRGSSCWPTTRLASWSRTATTCTPSRSGSSASAGD